MKTFEVHFTDCFPKIFEIQDNENINDVIKDHMIKQNSGVPKSEKIYIEKIKRI